MADSTPLAGLLDRAGNVFSLAGKLGRAFHEEGQSRAVFFDPSIWKRHAPVFNEFCDALLELRDAMQNPPDGFQSVAAQLLVAARLAKRMRDCVSNEGERDQSSWNGQLFGQMLGVQNPGPPAFTAYWEFFPDLNSVFENGWQAVKEVAATQRLDDPFAFLDEAVGDNKEMSLSLLDRFPATPAGHVGFLEMVRDEVHYAADAKQQQLARGYSNDTLASMVRGIKWEEAGARLASLSDLPEAVQGSARAILHRKLTVGTVEQIDALLTPAICAVRDALEQERRSDLASKIVVVATAGDLWKAYSEGKQPCFQSSGISIRPGANTPTLACTDDAAEAKRTALDRAEALVTAESGDKATAMERLIARVQLHAEKDKATVINMPLADFVAAAMGRGTASEGQNGSKIPPEALVQESDLERLVGALEDEIDDRETSIPDELVPPEPLRGGELYHAVQAVQRHYGGKLPVGPWQAWRGMLLRADEEKGEADPNERYERYYECGETLCLWAKAELSRITGANSESAGLIERLLDGPDDTELTHRELALLEAYLKQPISLSQIQRETQAEGQSDTAQRRNKLKFIRDFNRNLQKLPSGGTRQSEEVGPTESPTQPADGDGQDEDANRYAGLDQLQPAHRKAYLSFLYAEATRERRLEDRDAWEWLREHGIQDAEQTDLQDYELPAFGTWCRYLRVARKSLDERKYTPRSGRKRSG